MCAALFAAISLICFFKKVKSVVQYTRSCSENAAFQPSCGVHSLIDILYFTKCIDGLDLFGRFLNEVLKRMTHIIVLAVLIILLVLLRHYVRPAGEHFESSKSVVICKADWCGHCKHAAPEFDKLSAASPITLKDGSTASVKVLDADKDKAELSKYSVKGFPTILIVDGANTTEYPGERTHAGVLDFLNQTA